MKGGIAVAAIAALAGGANAINHRHAHELFAKRGSEESCGCSVVVQTITGEATLVPAPPPPTTSSTTPTPTPVTTTEHVPVPTPEPITCPTPGTYTLTATTVTLSETTTVCVGSSTHVPSGTHTLGGVTTVVETATTVTCPVATTTTSGDVVHSTIVSTEYVCPSGGTYTIAPITTTVTEPCDIEFPVPTSYNPGTYTAPEQVITVTETGYVTTCPYTSSGPTSTPAPAPEPSTPAPPPPPKPEEPKPEPNPKPGNGGGVGDDSDHYGITYTPYDGATGDCKSASQVDSDIAEIAADGFSVVRVYSTDCDTLPNVGSACEKHGMSMMVGVFVKETGCSYDSPDIKEQVDALAEWAQWDLVKLFIVGNEALMNGYCSAEELAELVSTVKSKCSGYTGPFTIAETLNIWLDPFVSSVICDAVDITGANIHPFFNAEILPGLAGTFVKGQLDILSGICPGKDSINLECGWPSSGTGNAGSDAQVEAIKSIRESCGGKTVFFSFENDMWKDAGECQCEQSWGCKDIFEML